MRREIQSEGASRRGKVHQREDAGRVLWNTGAGKASASRASSAVKMCGQTCGEKQRGQQIERRIN